MAEVVPGSQARGGSQAEAPSGDGKVWRPEGGSEALAPGVEVGAFCPPGAGSCLGGRARRENPGMECGRGSGRRRRASPAAAPHPRAR